MGGSIRTKVLSATVDLPGHAVARPGRSTVELEVQEPGVIPKQDVVPRTMLLDQGVLEDEGFLLCALP